MPVFAERLLLLADGAACGLFRLADGRTVSAALSRGGDMCMVRDSLVQGQGHPLAPSTHLTRYIPRQYKPMIQRLLSFRNTHSSSPYCCAAFHGDDLLMGSAESAWARQDVARSDVRVMSRRGDSELRVCPSGRRVLLIAPVLFPGEATDRRAEHYGIPRAVSMAFAWPANRVPRDAIGLLCATITALTEDPTVCPEGGETVLSVHPCGSGSGGVRADEALDFFREISPELPVLMDPDRYPSTRAVVAETVDGVLYMCSGPADELPPAGALSLALSPPPGDGGVECWLADEEGVYAVLALLRGVFTYHDARVGPQRDASPRRGVHLCVLQAVTSLAYDAESGRAVASAARGMDWVVAHREQAMRLALFHRQMEERTHGGGLGRLPDLGLCGSDHSSATGWATRGQSVVSPGRSPVLPPRVSHSAQRRNPADLFDNYSTALHARFKDMYADGARMPSTGLSTAGGLANPSCPILESTRCGDYALTVYVDGAMHGIFSDYTVIDLSPGLEVMRVMHPTGLEETLSVARVLDDPHIRAAEGDGDGQGEYCALLRLQARMRDKLHLMLAYQRFTTMDPETRLHTIHSAAGLVRSAQIEIQRNDMVSLLQQL